MLDPETTATAPPKVLPLVSKQGNRRLLTEWLEDHDEFHLVEPADSLSDLTFDVGVLDERALKRHVDELKHLKEATEPVILPYLLLVPEPGPELIDMEGGDLVENVLTRQIDEIVTLPIRQAELQWRIDSLLRLREQSLESRQRERRLQQYKRAVEGSTDMLAAADREYQLLFANERYRTFHGVSADEVRSLTVPELLGEERFAEVEPHIEAALSGEKVQFETEHETPDGTVRTLDTRYYPLEDDEGEIIGVVATIRDMTERKKREQKLRRTRRAVEASGHGIYITDHDGSIEYVNPAFEEITGYDEEEALGENPRILKSGEMPDDYYERLWDTVLSGEVWEETLVNRRKDGEPYHANQTIAPIGAEDGRIEGFVAIQTDITKRIEAEEELATFKEIVQRLDDPIMLQDVEGNYRVLNDAVAEYAGLSVDELEGKDEFAFMDERTATEIARQKSRVLEEERSRTYEVNVSFPTKGTRTFRTTRYPNYDEAGNLDGTVAICNDVTELVEREQHLEVLDRIMRHNLRTEMTIVQGQANHIAENPMEDNEEEAQRIRAASESLQELAAKERKIVEVLMEPGPLKSVPLCPVLARIIDDVTDIYPESEIAVECSDGLRVRALAEFKEALYEVIENAVKHCDVPRPHVDVTAIEEGGSVEISVADSGPGIPETEQRVLEGDVNIDPLIHGTGLGLWFVNQVVTKSEGTLRFRSNEPTGSIVELHVPSAEPPDDEDVA